MERQFKATLFERTVLSPAKVLPLVTQIHPDAATVFRDSYLVEFLELPDSHAEADLHRGLPARLKDFLIELGRDFCFVGSEYPVQVGGRDFALDLLFFHSRSTSPALIAEYQTQLPDKALLQAKLHEFYLQNASDAADGDE